MLLLVGLGNPGSKYAGHRHNIGFMALDVIAERHGFTPWRNRFQGEVAEGRLGGEKVIALKPQTYMNESGRSVGEALRFFKLTPEEVLVLHDELDLAPGKVKFKTGGGAAGHNGLRSIAAHIGQDFRRLRLGIGHPGSKEKVLGWVLNDFSKVDQDWLPLLLDSMAREADCLPGGEQAESLFMSKVMQGYGKDQKKKAKDREQAGKPEAPAQKPEAPADPSTSSPSKPEPQGLLAQALQAAFGSKKTEKKD